MHAEPGFRPQTFMLTRSHGLKEHLLLSGSPKEAATMSLFMLMNGLSEKCFGGSWVAGVEYSLWDYRQNGPRDEPTRSVENTITKRECLLLRLLSEECGGWWMVPDIDRHADPVEFVTLSEWEAHIRRRWIHPGGFVERR
jgi:hypothetical protein